MKRRLFLQLPLLASAIKLGAHTPVQNRATKGFKSAAHKDRFDNELHIMGGEFDCKVSSKDSNGELLIYDTHRHEKGGPPLHVHHEQDEWFFVIKGNFKVQVGEETFELNAGDSAFAPRKIPHAFAMTNEGDGQMLVLFQPAGTMEEYFLEMQKFGKSINKDMENTFKGLWEKHGMKVVGPPIKF